MTGAFGLYQYESVEVRPLPRQDPLEIWLGGMGPVALERAGLSLKDIDLVEMHEAWQESELFARVPDGLDGAAGAMLAGQLRAWFDDASLVASAA